MNVRFETTSSCLTPPPKFVKLAGISRVPVVPSLRNAFLAHGPAETNLKRLFEQDALCVTTGQQPGLLTGPLYTIYKALTAAALADKLETELERPVVPVFWVAGDDHDFAEANHLYLPAGPDGVTRVALRERDGAAQLTPIYRERVSDDIDGVLDHVVAGTRETEFRPGVLDWIRSHYKPENDLSSAFAEALAELLGQFGVVVFQPTHIESKRVMSSWILAALQQAEDLDERLKQHAGALGDRGETAPIPTGDRASTVMIESSLGRDRLVLADGGFTTRRAKEHWSLGAIEAVAANEPERFSPNVLLRPVVEAAILPTLAYVGGPAELAYLPQALPAYGLLDVEPQAFVPRWGGRVVENRTAKTLTKFGISADDLLQPEGQLEARIVGKQMPADATDAIERLRAAIESDYGKLADVVAQFEPSLKKAFVTAEQRSLRELAGAEKKIVQYLKQHNETTVRQLGAARASLFPMGKPQERVFNVVSYLVRYGNQFLIAAHEQCRRWVDLLETGSDGT